MLRKDVKLGFAIGGILLAVVIVYVLVVPSTDKKNVSVVTDDPQGKSDVTPMPLPIDGKSSDAPGNTVVSAKTAEPETANNNNAPPADPSKTDIAPSPATMPSSVAAGTSAKGSDWNKLLTEGSSSPTMMSETPTPDGKTGGDAAAAAQPAATDSASAASNASPASGGGVSANGASAGAATPETPIADTAIAAAQTDKATPDYSIDAASTPATQPAATGQRTHIVQQGEMLSTIASVVYGDSRKWKKIAAANPNINPNRLAPGTKLVIPSLSRAAESSSATVANLDPQTQYEVQANDSLYRISMKLYGKPDHVDKIYDLNKEAIGADPRRLKLHTVLKLPDPPTSTLTNTASR